MCVAFDIIAFIDISINKCFRQDVAFVPSWPIMLNNFQSTVDIQYICTVYLYSIQYLGFLCDLTNDHLSGDGMLLLKQITKIFGFTNMFVM